MLSHFCSLLGSRLRIPVSHTTFISQYDINDLFCVMFTTLISFCILLHLALIIMYVMCISIPLLGLAKCIPSLTFSSSSLNFLFQLQILCCLSANHGSILTSSSFSICIIVSQYFTTKHNILPLLLSVPSFNSATQFVANLGIFSTCLQNLFWIPSIPFHPTPHPNFCAIQQSGLSKNLFLHWKTYKNPLSVSAVT